VSLYGQAPYNGYSGYGGFASDPGTPVRPYYNYGVGSYDPAVSQNYYQQNSVNTAYRGYRIPDAGMTAAQWGTPLAAAGIYAMTGMHKLFGAKMRMASGMAARAAYSSVGLNPNGSAFSEVVRSYMRGGEAMLRNSFRRAGSFITGRAYAPVAEDALNVARAGSLGVGAARAAGGFFGEWIGGPVEAAWLGAKAANEGLYKPYAYSRAIANQALMQNSAVPYYGAGMGSVYTGTGLGSRGAANYGNAVEKYGMKNMFYSQQNAGHLAGLMQQAGLFSDKSTGPQLKQATIKALKDIRSILDVASLSGSEAIKMLSTYKQGGMSVSEGTKAIQRLAQYGALSGLGIKQLASQSFLPGAEQGASLGLIPAYSGQYGTRVTANFESYYHRGLLSNSVYGVLGGPAGAQQLALGGMSAYANSPLGQVGLYNDYMGRMGNAGNNIAGMMANFGNRFAQNPMNQAGLMQLNEPYMQSQLLKSKNRGKALRMAEAFVGQINPEEITKNGASAGAVEQMLTSVEGMSTGEARRLIYEQIAKQKTAGNSADLAARMQQQLRQKEMHEEHTGETWGGVPRAIEKNIYRLGAFTSKASRGASSAWSDVLHGFHEGMFDLEFGRTAYAMQEGARGMKDVEVHKAQLKRALEKGSRVSGVVTGFRKHEGALTFLHDVEGTSVGGINTLRGELKKLKPGSPLAENAGLAEQYLSAGDYSKAQKAFADAGIHVSMHTLKDAKSYENISYTKTPKIATIKWNKSEGGKGSAFSLDPLSNFQYIDHKSYTLAKKRVANALEALHQDPTSATLANYNRAVKAAESMGYGKAGAKMSFKDAAAQSVGLPGDSVGVKALSNLGTSIGNLKGVDKFGDGTLLSAAGYFSGAANSKALGESAATRATLIKDATALKDAKTKEDKFRKANVLKAELHKIEHSSGAQKIMKAFEINEKINKGLHETKDKINAKGVMQTMNLSGPVTMHATTVNVISGSSAGSSSVKSQNSAYHWHGVLSSVFDR